MSGSWLPPQALLLFARPGSRPPLPIETAVLDGFRAVLGRQCFGADQIGDRARHLEHTVVTAGGEPEARHRSEERRVGKEWRCRWSPGDEKEHLTSEEE